MIEIGIECGSDRKERLRKKVEEFMVNGLLERLAATPYDICGGNGVDGGMPVIP